MKTFVSQFIQSPFGLSGKTISTQEVEKTLNEVKLEIEKFQFKNSICFLLDSNPLRFCLSFFTLLDQGHCPIALSDELTSFQKENLKKHHNFSWLENGKFFEVQGEKAPHPNCYASMTSGTTSTPKLCYLSIEGAIQNAIAHADSMGISSEHTLVQNLPLNHSFGLVCYLWVKLVKKCRLDFNNTFLGLKSLQKRNDLSKGVLHASSSQLTFMLKEKIDSINSIEILSFGAGLVDTCDVLKIKKRFNSIRCYVSYGLTEAGPRTTTGQIIQAKDYGHIGSALKGIYLKVLSKGKLRDSGEGKLCINSPSLKLNLSDNEVIKNEQGKIFLITRDQVQINKIGEVYYLGREDDIIKVSGVSVYPRDIEVLCKQINGVKDCFVFGKGHKLYGEVPILTVETKNIDLNSKIISNFLKERLSVLQMPKKIILINEFPRFSLNKIDRKKLKKMVLS